MQQPIHLHLYYQGRKLGGVRLPSIPRVGEKVSDANRFLTIRDVVYVVCPDGDLDEIQLHCLLDD
ncbi:hypothetical protein [Spirosoma agri]|jgi:hypothetical protein|uniref:Uncharacterized protein n=1 Tax=Spirosoma agri TaxID=1987381 RepID=A0A6M0IBJ7_9BACT|nr:hypothetical protein [Spirosoma agri]NEU65494.1 hypothetical protein [Spirosoma agri]